MKFAIAKEHRDFFQKNGVIEFENFLTSQQVIALNLSLDKALTQRAEIPLSQIYQLNAEQSFINGRDLWRVNEGLQKFVCQPGLAQIVSELVEKKPIRIGYDQFLPGRQSSGSLFSDRDKIYSQFLEKGKYLSAISPVKEVLAGAIISLSNSSNQSEVNELEGIDIFPKKAGNITLISPQLQFDLTKIYQHSNQRFYLLVFTPLIAFYMPQPIDPLGHHLKQYYVINDKLSDKLNPIIYR